MAYRRTSDNLDSLRAAAQPRSYYEDDRRRITEARYAQRNPNTMGPSEEVLERRRRARRHHVETAPALRENGSITENLILLIGLVASVYALYRLCIYLLSQGL